MTETTDGGIVRLPGEGDTTSLFGDTYVVKAACEDTGGALAVIEAALAPHSGGTPLHVNTLEDENYYVVEGTLIFRLGERTGGNVRPHPLGRRTYPLERHRRAGPVVGLPRSGRV